MSERFLEVFLHPATPADVEAVLTEVLEAGEVTIAAAPQRRVVALTAWLPHPSLWTAVQRLAADRTVWDSGYCRVISWSADHVLHRGEELYSEGVDPDGIVHVRFGREERRCSRDQLTPELEELAGRAARALPDLVGDGRVVLPTRFGRHLAQAVADHPVRAELGPATRFGSPAPPRPPGPTSESDGGISF
jgi:hypothetical protein